MFKQVVHIVTTGPTGPMPPKDLVGPFLACHNDLLIYIRISTQPNVCSMIRYDAQQMIVIKVPNYPTYVVCMKF
jgi:hypothetical protein